MLEILNVDCRVGLRSMAAGSVQCCVTSPPYFALRDYGVAGQIGLEATPAAFVDTMVEVFAEVWRVLKDDGTLWLNLGDSYVAGAKNRTEAQATARSSLQGGMGNQLACSQQPKKAGPGLKSKDLIGIPWRVALALQEAGWYLRSDIIWHKPNLMPESVTDRPTKSHEYLFLLTKSERYYYDAEAITEPCSPATHPRVSQNVAKQIGSARANGGAKTNGNFKACVRGGINPKAALNARGSKQNESFSSAVCLPVLRRNKRTVWTVPNIGYKDAHFATFPPDLIKPCIMAGSRGGDMVLDPFGGSGTTGQVALELGRCATLIELNPAYCSLIRQRCAITPGFGF